VNDCEVGGWRRHSTREHILPSPVESGQIIGIPPPGKEENEDDLSSTKEVEGKLSKMGRVKEDIPVEADPR